MLKVIRCTPQSIGPLISLNAERQRLKRRKREEWRKSERSGGEKIWPGLVRMNHELGE